MNANSTTPDQLAALRQRDPQVLAQLVEENAQGLYRAARAWGLQPADAEDLVQDTFVAFLSGLDRFEGRSRVRTWLWGILNNKVRARKRARAPLPLDEAALSAPEPPDAVALQQAGQAIRHCLNALTPRQRGAFWLREIDRQPGDEAGRRLGMTANHCAVVLHRVRLMLQDCLSRAGWRHLAF